jgi:transposase
VRSTWIATRTPRINTSRGILREFGIVVANGASRVPARVIELIEDANTELPMGVRDVLNELVIVPTKNFISEHFGCFSLYGTIKERR